MKTEKINRKMKGSVLLTVVSVMGLLIIFLSGTLVLATAANRRAHRSYSTSQAELTAKAAIESFTSAMASNEKIAAAVQNLDKTYHPTVSIADKDLGHIGYYDGTTFIENAITIEPLTTTGKYVYGKFDLTNPGAEAWSETSQIKITVTARVGKEEKTVSAVLNKVGLSNNVPSDDIGLYAGGDASFDGGGGTANYIYSPLAVGLATDGGSKTKIKNGSQIYSPIIFFNSNAYFSNQSIIHVIDHDQATVIRGDFGIDNNFAVSLEYTMANDYTQKDIPYLFVEGDISRDADATGDGHFYVGHAEDGWVNVGSADSTYSPYNIFAGSIGKTRPIQNMKVSGDIYLMDAGVTSNINQETVDGGDLYRWADSVYNKTNNQNYSVGGNIYSKGNIKFGQGVKIKGNVRVEGNVNFSKSGCRIDGDLVVGGTITGIDNCTVTGTIYNDTLTGGAVVNTDYEKVYGNYTPAGVGSQYKKVENKKVVNKSYPNIAKFESTAETWTLAPSIMRISPDGSKSHKIEGSQLSSVYDEEGNLLPVVYVGSNHEWDFFTKPEDVPNWAGTPEEWTVEETYDYDATDATYISPDGTQSISVNRGSIGGVILDYVMVDPATNTILSGYDPTNDLNFYPVDKDGNELVGEAPVADSETWYRVDANGNVTDVKVPMGETYTYYLVDINGALAVDDEGNNIVIDQSTTAPEDLEYTYYDQLTLDAEGKPTKMTWAEVEAVGIEAGYYDYPTIPDPADPTDTSKHYTSTTESSVYIKLADRTIVSESEALAAAGTRKVEKIAAFRAKVSDEIYPAKMEKEIIYGSVVGGKFHKSTDTNQYILTLDDMRNKISCQETLTGDFVFDSSKYPTDISATPAATVYSPTKINYKDPSVQSGGIIKKSCVISGDHSNETIVIQPENEIWVVLDHVTLGSSGESKIVVDSGAGGDVKFFILGDLTLTNKSSIYSTLCMNGGDTIRYNQSLHIYYYGEDGSTINMSNNCLVTGYGRCPKTSVINATGTGPITVNYIDEHNNNFSIKPAWIGNVIYDGSSTSNNLTFALVKEGGMGMRGTIKTGIGYFEYEYFGSN